MDAHRTTHEADEEAAAIAAALARGEDGPVPPGYVVIEAGPVEGPAGMRESLTTWLMEEAETTGRHVA